MPKDLHALAWQHIHQAESYLARGDYNSALLSLKEAAELARQAEAPDIFSAVMGTTGRAMQNGGRYGEAVRCYSVALSI
jgi:tetratricopeptide (TPR) repeat protein